MASVFKPAGARKYVILYHDESGKRRKKTGGTDKQVTERIARDLENRVALRREGVVDPKAEAYRDHEARPLAEHLADWVKALEAKGTTPKHSRLFSDRARRIVALVMGATLGDIEPGKTTKANIERAEATLAKWVKPARLGHLTADRIQAALATLRAEGRSLATCNHHRTAIRAFSKWLHETHRTRENSLRGVTGFNAKEDRRHDRRTLALDELRRLIEVAATGPAFQRMTGPARALCYRLAVVSGLRYSEQASLTFESFDLGQAPCVMVASAYTKNGQTAKLPLPDDLAGDLAAFLAAIEPGAPAFPLPPEKGAKMLRIDLAAAGIPYRDSAGLVFDFHSLRCQCATLADAAGISPRVVQRIMRHSTLELTGRYTRPRAVDIEAAASLLPTLKPGPLPSESVALTGTAPAPISASTATEIATRDLESDPIPFACKAVTASRQRSHNPQVNGSSPVPGTRSPINIVTRRGSFDPHPGGNCRARMWKPAKDLREKGGFVLSVSSRRSLLRRSRACGGHLGDLRAFKSQDGRSGSGARFVCGARRGILRAPLRVEVYLIVCRPDVAARRERIAVRMGGLRTSRSWTVLR
jgi:integrase